MASVFSASTLADKVSKEEDKTDTEDKKQHKQQQQIHNHHHHRHHHQKQRQIHNNYHQHHHHHQQQLHTAHLVARCPLPSCPDDAAGKDWGTRVSCLSYCRWGGWGWPCHPLHHHHPQQQQQPHTAHLVARCPLPSCPADAAGKDWGTRVSCLSYYRGKIRRKEQQQLL